MKEEWLSRSESRVVISVMAGVEVMIEKRRMEYRNGGRGDDMVRE